MFTIEVKGKKYTVDKVTPRALYEMQPAMDMFNRINEQTQKSLKGEPVEGGKDDLKQAMDVLLDWFVVFCGNKFSREDLLDGYGADTIMTDIGVALRSVQMQVTEAIQSFPMTARLPDKKAAEAATPASAASRCRSTLIAWTKALRRR
jgi:hypothetical protein